jgi:SAM-dependent methyltransferase
MNRSAAAAYDALAPFYDRFTAHHDYELWTGGLLGLARAHGLTGNRALDAGCGTGKSFLPLLERGFDVTACDISPEMVELAQDKAGARADVHVADMRRLPQFGEFDLITCIDDAINHLLDPGEVYDALSSMRENLAPGGLLIFEVNTLTAYRQVPDVVVEDDDVLLRWRGELAELEHPGDEAEVVIDVFTHEGDGLWRRSQSRQRHRHHPIELLCALAEEAGLEVAAVLGQRPGAILDAELDEELHGKAVFVTRREGA